MEKTNSEKAIEKIEFLIDRLINYSESNKYDYALYKSFAKKSSKAFKRYFSEIDDQTIKDKIISDLKEDFHFKVNDVVIKMMAKPKGKIENFENGETYQITQPSQDNRIEGYESNYKELIELFFYSVQLETKEPQQAKNIKTDEVIKYNWFIIGLKFANGEMKTLLKTHNNNATKIADKLGNKDGFRPYISESIGVKKNTSEKSIYSDYDKMKTIIEYCEVNKIEIQSEFLMRFEELEQEQ